MISDKCEANNIVAPEDKIQAIWNKFKQIQETLKEIDIGTVR